MVASMRETSTRVAEASQIAAAAESEDEYPYIVAGAKIFCDHGTHFRRLDLPMCHGVYIRDKAATNEDDCVHPENIPIFGVCFSGSNPNDLVEYSGSNPEDLLPFEGDIDFPIIAKECTPNLGKWLNAKEDVLVDEKPALTARCTIVCRYGGIIGFADDGQGV